MYILTGKTRFRINKGGINIFKKLFGSFSSEKVEDEFDDFDIVNGVLIKKENFGKEQGREKTVHHSGLVFESKKVLEEIRTNEKIGNNKTKVEKEIYDEIFEEEPQEMEEEIEGYEIFTDLRRKKGRPRSIEGFYVFLQSAGRGELTIQTYKYALEWWEKMAEKNSVNIYNLRIKHIEEAIAGLDINTKKKNVSALKQLSKWYLREGFPHLNIETQKIILGKGKARIPKAKSKDEFKDIKDHAKELINQGKREGIWILLMITCGCRISEIQTVVTGEKSITVIGKGDKERKIPCPDYLLKALNSFQPDGRGGYKSKRQIIDERLRSLGYSHLHTLRHTYATVLHNRGLNLEEVSKLLGHADISTTQVYTQTKINEGVTDLLEID